MTFSDELRLNKDLQYPLNKYLKLCYLRLCRSTRVPSPLKKEKAHLPGFALNRASLGFAFVIKRVSKIFLRSFAKWTKAWLRGMRGGDLTV